ncbi:MAG: outer membrane protein assembly factor BamA [Candidatus Aminicenantes bacterium]|nr:outer membrane protein assembly factor BamA [Candidatus Aminicenantes bacterium]
MKKAVLALLLLALPGLLAAQEVLEKIEIVGNDRVTTETILYYLSAREGNFYSDSQLRRDFRVLWSTGFFSDIRIEALTGTRGRIVRITVEENPIVKVVTYKTGKKVKESDIVNKLKERDEHLLPYSYYSPSKLEKIKGTISGLLFEKGLLASAIEVDVRRMGKNEVEVEVRIEEGPKIRVGDIEFDGEAKLAKSDLVWAMKDNRPHSFFNWVAGKDVYKQSTVQEDADRIKKKFQERGYMEATVGEPRIEEIEKRKIFGKKQTMMHIVVPVNPGYIYRVGDIKIEGHKTFSTRGLQSMVRLKPGEVYSTKVREKSVDEISELYRDYGFLFIQVIPVENLDPRTKMVNVTFNIQENEVAYLNRLEFRGNVYTKDKVIRREMMIREGDRFSLAMFKNSILRIKQLGLVDLEKEPDIKPNPEDPTKIDVQVNVKELQRNNIQFTAGYSGYEGTFISFSYSTVNFLGAGENLEFTIQTGKLVKNYSFGFSEPYLFDLPITAGFNIYNRRINYPWYLRKDRGIDLITGARLFGMWRTNLTYTYANIDSQIIDVTDDSGDTPIVPPYMGGFGTGKYNVSSITPMLYRSTIDSPLTPTKGTMYSLSVKYAGTFLGGDVDLLKPQVEFTRYQPFIGKHVLGFHAQYQVVKAIKGSPVPYWERFFLGGERSIRGYDPYRIGPTDANGYNMGGDKALVLNAEYIIPVGGPIYAILFFDMGNAVSFNQSFSLKDMYTSSGIEARIFVPALRVPFRLIFSFNNKKIFPNDPDFAFRFAVGTTF